MVLAAATDWGQGDVLLTFIYIMFVFMYIWVVLSVFIDIFRSHDMGGIHKAAWVLAIFVFQPFAILAYLIVRGGKMNQHAIEAAKAQDDAMQKYIRNAAGTTPADELHRLADLKDRGVIDDAEFQKLKAKVLN